MRGVCFIPCGGRANGLRNLLIGEKSPEELRAGFKPRGGFADSRLSFSWDLVSPDPLPTAMDRFCELSCDPGAGQDFLTIISRPQLSPIA